MNSIFLSLALAFLPAVHGNPNAKAFSLSSSAFSDMSPIPKKYTSDGENISPALAWHSAPTATKEFALICEDPDAPRPEPWVHWVVYKIPASATALKQGAKDFVQGRNSWGNLGYGGPQPPPGSGWHRYFFRLYALSAPLDLPSGATKAQLLQAMSGKIIGKAEFVGKYQR